MPAHVGSKVDASLFHHFHQRWTGELCDGLNDGVLPPEYFALGEQKGLGLEPEVMTLTSRPRTKPPGPHGAIGVAEHPPQVGHVRRRTDAGCYAAR